MIKNLKRILFSLIIFLIPVNLGKHFISVDSYVNSRLIDYLIPTVWLIDILIFILIVLWIVGGGFKNIRRSKVFRLVIVFVSVLIPSVFIAVRLEVSVYSFLSLFLKILFMLFVSVECNTKQNFSKIVKILSCSVFLVSILGLLQWFKQGSVFDNYLFFGEQPYDPTTFDLAKVNIFGRLKVPPYSTFRHPNVLAGFLSTVLIWMHFQITTKGKDILLKISFTLGLLCLFLTFSQTAYISFFLAILFLILIKRFGKKGVIAALLLVLLIVILSLTMFVIDSPVFERFYTDPSFFRRANLLKSSYSMIKEHMFFGVGLNNFTIALPDYLPLSQILVFNQPVHNIFILLLSEAGVFALVTFIALILFSLFVLLKQPYGIPAVLFVTILHFIILGSFDHYLFTIHQTQTIFWLTLGLSLAYTEIDENQ